MIDNQWTLLKASLITEGGHDRLVDFLEFALECARIERAKHHERERRLSPDYAALTPHDLQVRVATALAAST